jgi:hypothetical protein
VRLKDTARLMGTVTPKRTWSILDEGAVGDVVWWLFGCDEKESYKKNSEEHENVRKKPSHRYPLKALNSFLSVSLRTASWNSRNQIRVRRFIGCSGSSPKLLSSLQQEWRWSIEGRVADMGVADLPFLVGYSPSGKEWHLAISTNSNLPCVRRHLSQGKPDIGGVVGERRGKGSGNGWWVKIAWMGGGKDLIFNSDSHCSPHLCAQTRRCLVRPTRASRPRL